MKYTAEQIKPKHYPEEKPSEGYTYFYHDINYGVWGNLLYHDSKWGAGYNADWFIDIPGAPPELKPLAYPQNKPEKDGEYWTHHAHTDEWKVHEYKKENLCWWKAGRIDYFINVRLDKENEMELKILVDWRKDKDMVNLNTGRVTKDDFRTICTQFLDAEGYDVVKREPEIKACPFCKSPKFGCKLFRGEVSGMGMKSWIECVDECGYQSAYYDTDKEAIRLHNLIADNALSEREEE